MSWRYFIRPEPNTGDREWAVWDARGPVKVLARESHTVCANVAESLNTGAMGITECDEVAQAILAQRNRADALLDLWGEVADTGYTESQLNGWREPGTVKPDSHGRSVCVCGHGPQFHQRGYCERCSHRHWAHAYQRAATESLFGALW